MENRRIAIIGAGAMGSAVAAGLAAGGYDPALITVANPHPARLAPLEAAGINTTTHNRDAIAGADLIVIAVKPWILPEVAAEIRDAIDPERQEVTAIVAGIEMISLKAMFNNEGRTPRRLSIAMPNTAMTAGCSMTFIVATPDEAPLAGEVFARLGTVRYIAEKMLPAATALASCGIAYALRYVRAAMEGGVELGFKASEAQEIIAATIRGAAALLDREGAHPETEIDKVTTPGGITIRGLNAMEQHGFSTAVIAGLRASVKK